MARSARFERATAGTANQCSIQLSYERSVDVDGNYTKKIFKMQAYAPTHASFALISLMGAKSA